MARVTQFEGDVRLWEKDPSNGNLTPVIPTPSDPEGNLPIEVNQLQFSYEPGEEKKVTSKGRDTYGQTIYSETLPGEASMQMQFLELPPAILAMIFYGELAVVAVTSGAVTDEPVTVGLLGNPVRLAFRYLNSGTPPVVMNAGASVTYVLGTDYTVDYRLGLIVPLATGTIIAGQALLVDYTKTAYTLERVRGGVKPTRKFYVTGDLKNRVDNSDVHLEAYEWNAITEGEVDLFSDDPITVTANGTLITPTGKTEPYIVARKIA